MSKQQKPSVNRKTKAEYTSEDFKKLFDSLKDMPMDYAHDQGKSCVDNESDESDDNADYTPSNVEFVVGDSIEDTEVYVDGVQIKGCIKASLDYNSEFGVPTLTLTVIGPAIVSPACRNCGM